MFENNLLTEFKNAIKEDSHTETLYRNFKQNVKSDPEFKVTQKMKEDITQALNNTTGALYRFFKTHDFNDLYSPVENSLPNLIEQSKEGKAYYKEVFNQAYIKFQSNPDATAQSAVASQPPPQGFGIGYNKQVEASVLPVQRESSYTTIGNVKYREVFDPSTGKMGMVRVGGKSRRRHRRVKFGKSKKGRTTRRIIRKHRR